jgi:D-alanine-D-alanine ligase
MRILVLAGGLSPERDVSLRSGRRVAEALRVSRPEWEVAEADVDAALLDTLVTHPPDAVVPLLHGAAGEDGSLRDLLDSLGLAYVGADGAGGRMAFDKPVAGTLVRGAGIAVPKFSVLPQTTFRELGAARVMAAIGAHIGYPLVVKPTRGGSALGVAIVAGDGELPAALVGAFSYAETAMIQTYVSGTEIAAGVIDIDGAPTALPLVEIVPDGALYDYTARYTAGTTEFFCPARLDDAVTARVQEVALRAHSLLGLRHLSRTDVIVDSAETVWYLETNAAPGMTETSLMPQALVAAGLDAGEAIARIIAR